MLKLFFEKFPPFHVYFSIHFVCTVDLTVKSVAIDVSTVDVTFRSIILSACFVNLKCGNIYVGVIKCLKLISAKKCTVMGNQLG